MKKKPSKSRRKPATHDSEVGYGRPPANTRWQKGQSGNPRGRPKGTKNINTMVHEVLTRRVKVRDGEALRKVPFLEAMFLNLAAMAMKGNIKAFQFLLSAYDEKSAQVAAQKILAPEFKRDEGRSAADVYREMVRQVVG